MKPREKVRFLTFWAIITIFIIFRKNPPIYTIQQGFKFLVIKGSETTKAQAIKLSGDVHFARRVYQGHMVSMGACAAWAQVRVAVNIEAHACQQNCVHIG